MAKDYLTWFKDLDAELARRRGAHSLISSNVSEPLDMLEKLIRENAVELRRLQKDNNDWGHPVLKERIAGSYGLGPENILLTNGGTNANFLVITTLLGPGDTVICEHPCYQPLWQLAQMAGGRIRWLSRKPPHYGVDTDELSALIDGRTRLVLLTNLHNPSGASLDKGQLRDIARTVRARNKSTRILVDEVFGDLDPGHCSAAALDPIFITTSSLSKAYGLSHLKCGWVATDCQTIRRLTCRFVLAEGNGSRYLESLSALVFARLNEFLERSLRIVESNRRVLKRAMAPYISSGLLDQPIPDSGCIWFPGLKRIKDSGHFCRYAVHSHRLHVVPGGFFGDRSRFRVGFGSDPELFSKATKKLAAAVAGFESKR